MTEIQSAQVGTAIREAVTAAIQQVGVGTLKATSMFLSNERVRLKKAA